MPQPTPLLSEALEEYLAIRASHVAASTLRDNRYLLARFVREIGDRPVEEVTNRLVEPWFSSAATAAQSAHSYNNNRSRINVFFGFCSRRGWLVGNPLGEIGHRRVIGRHRLRLTGDQLRLLYESAPVPRDRGMLALSVCTGMRASDLVALRVGDVNLALGTVRVSYLKTGQVDRLPLALEANVELRRWLVEYARRMSMRGRRLMPDFVLFPPADQTREYHHGIRETYGAPIPDRPLTHSARIAQDALRAIGFDIEPGEGFHTIRRSVGRLVFDQASAHGHDAALRLTASLLGHATTASTERYLGLSIDRVKRDEFIRGRRLLGKATPLERGTKRSGLVSLP
jgi:integrase